MVVTVRVVMWAPFDLTGTAAVVTGGAIGIGYACCVRLREAGADVMGGASDDAAGPETAD